MIKGILIVGTIVMVLGFGLASVNGKNKKAPPPHVPLETVPSLMTGNKVIGATTAPLRVAEFSDFECPACRETHDAIAELMLKYPGKLAVVFHHFPVYQRHPNAIVAGQAAECAVLTGAFEPMYDTLFASQDDFAHVRWANLAASAGVLDTVRFTRCLASPESRSAVDRDQLLGRSIGVHAVPSLVIDTLVVLGAQGIRSALLQRLEALPR